MRIVRSPIPPTSTTNNSTVEFRHFFVKQIEFLEEIKKLWTNQIYGSDNPASTVCRESQRMIAHIPARGAGMPKEPPSCPHRKVVFTKPLMSRCASAEYRYRLNRLEQRPSQTRLQTRRGAVTLGGRILLACRQGTFPLGVFPAQGPDRGAGRIATNAPHV